MSIESVNVETQQVKNISDFMPKSLQKNFKKYLGPNWMFHAENEISARTIDYVFLDEYPEHMREKRATELAQMVSDISEDIFAGRNILDNGTRSALYNWWPNFKIRDVHEEHPYWPINTIDIGGGACIINIGRDREHNFAGVEIPHGPVEKREEAWLKSVEELTTRLAEDGWKCQHCFDHDKEQGKFPPPLKLRRQNAEPLYSCQELYQVNCPECNRKEFFELRFN